MGRQRKLIEEGRLGNASGAPLLAPGDIGGAWQAPVPSPYNAKNVPYVGPGIELIAFSTPAGSLEDRTRVSAPSPSVGRLTASTTAQCDQHSILESNILKESSIA